MSAARLIFATNFTNYADVSDPHSENRCLSVKFVAKIFAEIRGKKSKT